MGGAIRRDCRGRSSAAGCAPNADIRIPQSRNGDEHFLTMAELGNAEFFQVVAVEFTQGFVVNLVFGKCVAIVGETKAGQPVTNIQSPSVPLQTRNQSFTLTRQSAVSCSFASHECLKRMPE